MKRLQITVATLFIMFVAIGVVIGWWQWFDLARMASNTHLDRSGYRGESDENNFYIISPSGARQLIPKSVAGHLTGPEWLTSFVMPIDPTVPHAILLSTQKINNETSGTDGDKCGSINRIYRYVIGTDFLEELYSENSDSGSPMVPGKCRILRTAGRIGSRLVLLVDDPDNSPGPCTNIWTDYADRFVVFDTNLHLNGLKLYEPPRIAADDAAQGPQCSAVPH